jgi:L-lysine 6-transaminase
MHYLFFVEGGTLAVENGLKAAFDWKVRKNLAAGKGERGSQVIHFEHAFHGRSGYCLSLTNSSDLRKTQYFPKFPWPRVVSPEQRFPIGPDTLAEVEALEAQALAQIHEVVDRVGPEDIASIIIETIQCEGGDRHLRPQFLKALRELSDRHDFMLIFDEVQTGMGSTGTMWHYEQLGVEPDVVVFAKKAQTGGIMASRRLDEVESVFHIKSRISSTFGGNLVDFVRATRYLEIIREEKLLENAKQEGAVILRGLQRIAAEYPPISNVRGIGVLCAFDLADGAMRDRVIARAQEEGLLVLPCGDRSVRLRPALDVHREDVETALAMLERAVQTCCS